MNYTMPVRDPNLAYRDTWLWLPKRHVSTDILKNTLTIPITRGKNSEDLVLWRDSPFHLGVPREKMGQNDLPCEVVDLTPSSYQHIPFQSSVELDRILPEKDVQRKAYADLKDAPCGILELGCGIGKTPIMLHAISEWAVPTLIITKKGHVLRQIQGEINKFLTVPGEIGWIQGPVAKWRWKCPLVLASLKTLALHADDVPLEMRRYFGVVVWDELHNVAAPWFSRTADMFFGRRYGMTATMKRADGAEVLYLWHVGPPVHTNLEQDVIPTVVFVRSDTTVDMSDPIARDACTDSMGEYHVRKLAAYVGQKAEEMTFTRSIIDQGLKLGRTMLAISLSSDHVERLHKIYPNSGLLNGSVKQADRLAMLREHPVVFGTIDMAEDALDRPDLDTLIILTEYSSERLLQQSTGRIQRYMKDKPDARVIVVWHHKIGPMMGMGRKLMKHFKNWGIETEVR